MTELKIDIDVPRFITVMRSMFQTRHVFMRELVQNSLEAINQVPGDYDGAIAIETSLSDMTISVRDDGIGMTREKISENLLRVFNSGWPTDQGKTLGIGQFGFGFFSVFLDARKATVLTRPLSEPAVAYELELSVDDGIFHLDEREASEVANRLPCHGTLIELELSPSGVEILDTEAIIQNLAEIYLYTACPIFVDDIPLGAMTLDGWARSTDAGHEASDVGTWLRERYEWDADPLAVHAIGHGNGGWLAIAPEYEVVGGVEVFRRGIRVTTQELVPEPLNIIMCGLVDVDDINVKPDRETLRDDADLQELKDSIRVAAESVVVEATRRSRQGLLDLFDAHGRIITEAMRRSEFLREAIGRRYPVNVTVEERGETTIPLEEALDASGRETLYWIGSTAADQLFADRARHLRRTPVILADRSIQKLVRTICESLDVRMMHVAEAYIQEVQENETMSSPLVGLFAPIVGEDSELICCEDVDRRFPVRLLNIPSLEASRLERLSGNLTEGLFGSLLEPLLQRLEQKKDKSIVVVNRRNDVIQKLEANLSDPPSPAHERAARILVAMARFMGGRRIHMREFEEFNNELLRTIKEDII